MPTLPPVDSIRGNSKICGLWPGTCMRINFLSVCFIKLFDFVGSCLMLLTYVELVASCIGQGTAIAHHSAYIMNRIVDWRWIYFGGIHAPCICLTRNQCEYDCWRCQWCEKTRHNAFQRCRPQQGVVWGWFVPPHLSPPVQWPPVACLSVSFCHNGPEIARLAPGGALQTTDVN